MKPFKKALQVVGLVHSLDPWALAISGSYAFFVLVMSYFPTLFLALVLNQFQAQVPQAELLRHVVIYLAVLALVGLITAGLKKLNTDSLDWISFELNARLTRKSLEMAYTKLISPDIRLMYQRAEEGSNSSGGIQSFVEDMVQSLFTILFSIFFSGAALVSLMLAKSPFTTSLAGFANSEGTILLMGALILVPMVISVWTSARSAGVMYSIFKENTTVNREMSYYVSTIISNEESGKLIRLYRGAKMIQEVIHHTVVSIIASFGKGMLKMAHYESLGQIATLLCMGGLYVLIGIKAYTQAILVGTLLLNVNLIQNMVNQLVKGLSNIASYSNLVNYLSYYSDYLAIEDESFQGASMPDQPYMLRFDEVSYRYPGSDQEALSRLSLSISLDEVTGLVGKNGCGKSTLVKLICRLISPTSGTIYLNDQDIQTIALDDYRKQLGVVFQDFRLFAYSVEENICAGATLDEAWFMNAIAKSHASSMIDHLPHREKTVIKTQMDDEGVELSGGQAQKLAMARAWYKQGATLILDEPTAALDPLAEFELYQDFNHSIQGKGALVISHRMSSCKFCQRILVFDQGKLVDEGNHDSLMARHEGVYYELYSAQAQYYQ